jgi:isopentenyl-diphosphate delta-isomerase
MEEQVILVDADDNVIGTMDKLQAHQLGRLHRAFSVFIFDTKGQLLLQQRAMEKYHSGGKWTNTCCSHPRLNETNIDAANRRLMEEMGLTCALTPAFNFIYRSDIVPGLTEHEIDHVFFGINNIEPKPNPDEVMHFKYINMADLAAELKANPDKYSSWLNICFDQLMIHYQQFFKNKE